ncbi:cell division protein ZapE [Sphingomonas guangdongensis]|uniref:Cell division protein ZapE n=1 Tax=Sphingomonas guangdongensis TaxID=1141890 RepID=A0A285QBL8_9SPHN|nr:cell division protein ZapE [Sphingomonas guangdongensis]SOB79211.1 cell division protein ZapE [Sphingomonas guangdongensis]
MGSVLDRYNALVVARELRSDPEQAAAAKRLDALATALEAGPPRRRLLARLTGQAAPPPRGVYLWGGVGRGKSMLMDLLFHNVAIAEKRRVHFHEFMLEVHERLSIERRKEAGNPVPPVAAALADGLRLLAFDEMVINNTADAMVLSRLFTEMMGYGLTVVATSNRPPAELYKDGLQRESFLPFVALLEGQLDVLPLNGPVDYRLDRLGKVQTWLVPISPANTATLSAAFFRLTDYPPEDSEHVPSEQLRVSAGRSLHVPKSLKGVAVFSFKRLCGDARGAPDYLAIARAYHTVVLVAVPRLTPENRNEAARFVTLIDALYEHNVKLLAMADAEPEALYVAGDGAFEFERTVSRLREMGSDDYLAKGHGAA